MECLTQTVGKVKWKKSLINLNTDVSQEKRNLEVTDTITTFQYTVIFVIWDRKLYCKSKTLKVTGTV